METLDDILLHQRASQERLNLVASENLPSITARLAFLTDIIARYYFPLLRNHSAFPGNEFLERIHLRCEKKIGELVGARFVSVRPIAGLSAMTVALAGLLRPGETVATLSPDNGGHTLTVRIARRLGLRLVYLPYLQEDFEVDLHALPDFMLREKPSLIYLDQANILFPRKITEMRARTPEEIKIYYDGSHVMGLIFGKSFQDPLKEGASFLGGSTHKTVPGPHKAFIATNNESDFEIIKKSAETFISHAHSADIAALAIVLEEMEDRWKDYAVQIVKNAQYLSRLLDERGFSVVGRKFGYTKTHQIWIDIAPITDAFDAAQKLASCNIIVNTFKVPSLPERLSLRLGVQEITYLGAKENTMEEIAKIFEDIFVKKLPEDKIKNRVREIKSGLRVPLNRGYLKKILDEVIN